MILLAVSGGPDSMALLNDYKNKRIVVAHVNYGMRNTSNADEKIVRDFCNEHNIPFFIKKVKGKNIKNNFQEEARRIRYAFFKEIYSKGNISKIVTGHHKDDFIETAIMQENSGREPMFYGIKRHNKIDGMNVYRPYVDTYWKSELIEFCNKYGVDYEIDESNADTKYTRNKIRKDLADKTIKEKNKLLREIYKKNKVLKKKLSKTIGWYLWWKRRNYNLHQLKEVPEDFHNGIVFELVFDHFRRARLTKGKLDSLVDFLFGKEGNKKFIIDRSRWIKKEGGHLSFEGDNEQHTKDFEIK